ncbi:hypothetical protein H7H37_11410, partial [Mycolicibacterium insubricum]|nr:hypothetical protein [Mycolicibacterium insubricum]
ALVDRSLHFGDLTAEELMTPRTEIVALDADQTVADLVAAASAVAVGRSRSRWLRTQAARGVRARAPGADWPDS